MRQGIEGSFENPIEVKTLLDLAPVDYRKFVKVNGQLALFDEPQIIDWADQTLKNLGAYFLIEIGAEKKVFYQRVYLLKQGLKLSEQKFIPVRTHVIEKETQPYFYAKFLSLIERAKSKNGN